MTMIPIKQFICPLDGSSLTLTQNRWECEHSHSFDIAKRGYTNFLLSQFKRSKDPGDSKEMVAARHRFLETGFYTPLADALANFTFIQPNISLLDAGCGEGYYVRRLAEKSAKFHVEAVGLDISKPAIDSAAKFDKSATWLVASNANIPLPDKSIDIIWSIFGYPYPTEFLRVLKPGGRIIQVDAGPEHLLELRQIIYPTIKEKKSLAPLINDPCLTLTAESSLQFSIELCQVNIHDLLLMTPHLFKASPERRNQALTTKSLKTQVDMTIRVQVKAKH